jgi:hypothetical protein
MQHGAIIIAVAPVGATGDARPNRETDAPIAITAIVVAVIVVVVGIAIGRDLRTAGAAA